MAGKRAIPVRMIERPVMAWISVNDARSFFAMVIGRGSTVASGDEYVGSMAFVDFGFNSGSFGLTPSKLKVDVCAPFSSAAVSNQYFVPWIESEPMLIISLAILP